MKRFLLMIPAALMLSGCSLPNTYVAGGNSAAADDAPVFEAVPRPRTPEGFVLKASAFRMSGNYADNVAITLATDGSVAYFPAPSDITEASRPVDLGNGWWLNRQGISRNSVFTTYTFEEYSKLKATPSAAQLKEAVIPGATVVEMVQLPFAASDAAANLPAIKEYLKNK